MSSKLLPVDFLAARRRSASSPIGGPAIPRTGARSAAVRKPTLQRRRAASRDMVEMCFLRLAMRLHSFLRRCGYTSSLSSGSHGDSLRACSRTRIKMMLSRSARAGRVLVARAKPQSRSLMVLNAAKAKPLHPALAALRLGRPLSVVAKPAAAVATALPKAATLAPFSAAADAAVAAATPAPAPPAPFDPNKTMGMIQTLGLAQRDKGSDQLFAASFLGGAMLSWGSILMMVVAGGAPCLAGDPGLQALLRGTVFPLGLSLIVLSKSELVTANFLTQALPPPSADALRVVGVSFAANLAGSLAMVGLASYAGIFTPGGAAMIVKAASGKAALSPGVAFAKGVGANWLVNLAVFQAMSSPTAPGKIAALWFPILTFITLNLEHSVANMFFLPFGMFQGAEISVGKAITANLIPVTLGNLVGGAVFVALAYHSAYGN
mmetsp:Transcript_1765/g.5277  ORF Transcript_1765/g.5277 Transcript_1765/m.5277 type:complete len:435 (-) Transcript_1765:95-1399(-)